MSLRLARRAPAAGRGTKNKSMQASQIKIQLADARAKLKVEASRQHGAQDFVRQEKLQERIDKLEGEYETAVEAEVNGEPLPIGAPSTEHNQSDLDRPLRVRDCEQLDAGMAKVAEKVIAREANEIFGITEEGFDKAFEACKAYIDRKHEALSERLATLEFQARGDEVLRRLG